MVSLDIEPLLELARCLYEGPWVTERWVACKDFLSTNPPEKDLDPTVMKIIKGGENYTAATAFEFEYKRQRILKKVTKLLKGTDAIIVPTAPLNPTIEQVTKEPIKVNSYQGTYTNFVNLADMSALAIPAGFRSDGLPFGITLLSDKFNDYALLELASRYLKTNSLRTCGVSEKKVSTIHDVLYQLPKPAPEETVKLAVVGAHLKGFELHWQLEKVDARFIESTTTSKNYKLYALPKTGPVAKPGLRRVDSDGESITIEIYSIPKEKFGEFIKFVPEPLGIGSVELKSGEWCKSFICEEFGYKQPGTVDITGFGGWKNYQESFKRESQKKPFNSVLVANRGEIAVRIIKTLKKLNIKSISIYSDPDKYAQHALMADVAIPLHGTTAAETYINVDKVIKAAKESGAEAIIPGYGFYLKMQTFLIVVPKKVLYLLVLQVMPLENWV